MEDQDAAASYSLPAFLLRWQEYVSSQSPAFKSLKCEQKLGWESKALDWLYSKNKKTSNADVKPPGESSVTVAAPPTTHFFGDVEGLCDRYRKHAEMIFSRSDEKLFCTNRNDSSKTFVDLGCAPGGVSAFLALDLHWDGVGVSLPVEDGGIAITTKLVPTSSSHATGGEAPSNFLFLGGSVLDSKLPTVIQRSFLDKWYARDREQNFVGFDFVNGGAVQDHGQRSTAGDGGDSEQSNEGPALPWFYFLVPQLLTALTLVRRDGHGSVMVVYGMSQCGSIMLLLHLLVKLNIIASFDQVDFLETMHLTKPPIYLMLRGVTPTDRSIHLLSQYFSPPPTTTIDDSAIDGKLGNDDGACPRRSWAELKSFWRLDEESQRRDAAVAFEACGSKLEVIWRKAEVYLKTRREKAERAMQQSAARESDGIGRQKRSRD